MAVSSGASNASSSPTRLLPSAGIGAEALQVAVLAPPWISVPPPGYGGIEAVVALLCEGLVGHGHEVTLFAAPGSRSAARVRPLLEDAPPCHLRERFGTFRLADMQGCHGGIEQVGKGLRGGEHRRGTRIGTQSSDHFGHFDDLPVEPD